MSSGCSPGGGRTSRTSPSTASTSPRAVVSLPCRNCVLALHSCRPSTCTGFACQAYLSEHVSHAAALLRRKKCIWLVCWPLCVFSTGSAGRRRMPRLANVCDTLRTLLLLPNKRCISLVWLYGCSSSTYSGVLDQKRKEVDLGRSSHMPIEIERDDLLQSHGVCRGCLRECFRLDYTSLLYSTLRLREGRFSHLFFSTILYYTRICSTLLYSTLLYCRGRQGCGESQSSPNLLYSIILYYILFYLIVL